MYNIRLYVTDLRSTIFVFFVLTDLVGDVASRVPNQAGSEHGSPPKKNMARLHEWLRIFVASRLILQFL
jgi:hypothetical protein